MVKSTKESQLRAATRRGDVEEAERLLKAGAKIDARTEIGFNSDGNSALDIAVADRKPEIAELLLERGADPNQPDGRGRFPLDEAIKNGDLNLVAILIKRGASAVGMADSMLTLLHSAARHGRLKMCRILVEGEGGVDINAKTKGGATPLAVAVANKRTRVVRYLRSKGAVE